MRSAAALAAEACAAAAFAYAAFAAAVFIAAALVTATCGSILQGERASEPIWLTDPLIWHSWLSRITLPR